MSRILTSVFYIRHVHAACYEQVCIYFLSLVFTFEIPTKHGMSKQVCVFFSDHAGILFRSRFMSPGQTGKTKRSGVRAVRETEVYWHHGGPIEAPLKPLSHHSIMLSRDLGGGGFFVPHYSKKREPLGQLV